MSTVTTTLIIDQTPDWGLVCAVARCEVDLPESLTEELNEGIWSFTDAYGEVGYLPSQGWDWSGIRDSSDAAKRQMAQYLRRRLTEEVYPAFTVIERR